MMVSLVALAACTPGILNDFVYDDLPIIRDNVRVHDLALWREWLTTPYWPPPFVQQLYRPVAVAFLAVQYALGDGSPMVFRAVSYLLYLACALAMLRLADRVLGPTAALVATIIFAAHPVHVEAVALGVNQGELIVGLIAMVSAALYVDGRRRGDFGFGRWIALSILYAVAALTKEHAFIIPGLLLCAEMTLVSATSFRERVRSVAPGFAVMAVAAMGVLVARAAVLSAAMTVIPVIDLRGKSLGERLLAMLQMVPTWFRLLAFPAWLRVDYHLTTVAWQAVVLSLFGLALVAAALVLAYRARTVAPAVSFGIAWCCVALLPVSNLIPTGVLVAERTLFLPSVGFMIAVGGAATWWSRRNPSPLLRRRLLALAGLMALAGAVGSAVRHLSWNSAHVRIRSSNTTAPPRSR